MATKPLSCLDSRPIEPQLDAPILQMPSDILFAQIFPRISTQEIGPLTLVCRQLCQIFEHDDTFRSIFRYQFLDENEEGIGNFKNVYHFKSNVINEVYALSTFKRHKKAICCLAIDEPTLFSASWYKTVKVWDIKTGKCTATFEGHEQRVSSLALSGSRLFSGSSDKTIKVWDIKTGKCTATFEGHEQSVSSLAIDGETLFSGSWDNTIKVWSIKTGECIATFKGHEDSVFSLALSGSRLFSGSSDKTIKVWDIKTGKCTATFKGHEYIVFSLAISGSRLFSGSWDKTIKVWDIETGECIATLKGHEDCVFSLAIAGQMLFSGSRDDRIKVWDIKTGKCVATFKGHTHSIGSVAIAGQTLFSGSDDGLIISRNFTADHNTIFKQIAQLLKTESPKAIKDALKQFSKMPIRARHKICDILYKILDEDKEPTSDENKERAEKPEDIFYDRCKHRRASSSLKALAIWEWILSSPSPASSSGFSANGKRTYGTAFDTDSSS